MNFYLLKNYSQTTCDKILSQEGNSPDY